MEETPEGLAVAAATREAARLRGEVAKRKREAEAPTDAKRAARVVPVISHEVAVPKDFDEAARGLDPALYGTLKEPCWEGPMAKKYPFVLDPFQKVSIACIERGESVLVSAHTSAGKTAVAEYAIARALGSKQRVIYTSPLKALSNQKFRELGDEFGEVGIMTGDVSINPEARCLVMTTEILRSMLYRGSELLREVSWVIFDEVHYMQDRERGVVWEEAIIFLPRDIKMVFLSATLSNAAEFAGWVAALHAQPCHVVYTDFRPTPLQHYAFACGSEGLYLIMDETGRFREEQFAKLRLSFGPAEGEAQAGAVGVDNGASTSGRGDGSGGRDGGRWGRGRDGGRGRGRGRGRGGRGDNKGGGDTADDISKILKLIQLRKFDPVIVFSFSRRECEAYAMKVKDILTFNSAEEAAMVEEIFNNAMGCLGPADRELEVVVKMLPLLKKGIGVHHSGLLPLLKEMVELLFQEGLVKALFATETFAMGLNMPAKTVVFTAMQKWDGETHRWMASGEYIQMSGRAGRRGKDDRGFCFMMVDDQMDAATCRSIVQGKPSPLLSSFKLSYYTLLNLLRRAEGSGKSMEYVIQRSFQQFQFERTLPALQSELALVEAKAASIGGASSKAMAEYHRLRQELAAAEALVLAAVQRPDRCIHLLRPGRLVRVRAGASDWGWGVVVSVLHTPPRAEANGNASFNGGVGSSAAAYVVDTLLQVAPGAAPGAAPKPAPGGEKAEMQVVPVPLTMVAGMATLRISIPTDLRPPEARKATLLTLRELEKRYPDGLPRLDPLEDLGVDEPEALAAVRRMEALEAQLAANPAFQAERGSDPGAAEAVARKAALAAQADALRAKMRESHLANFRMEAKRRTAVLRRLGHVTEAGLVTLKGRAACEIDTADELLTSELLLNGVFNSLDVHQLVALVSCLVPVDTSKEMIRLREELADALSALQDTARCIAEAQQEAGLAANVEEYVESFKPFLMDIIHAWSRGATFEQICKMTDIFEGSIIRATRRLDELMRQLAEAAGVLGDVGLQQKFLESDRGIRRDLMFAASLYL
ncbi:hypothetical protein WJX81_004706 [Elliptochloris bilobata]|uniref:Superkiller viralicidic activity 2-like 2 n=1 Tax=Elliptochloris bilobata TaxID=381761 RepID=A0AAW1RYR5_9CHLO